MTPEEKVLEELKEKIHILFEEIQALKVAQEERRAFELEKDNYRILIEDYKRHREALLKREECLK